MSELPGTLQNFGSGNFQWLYRMLLRTCITGEQTYKSNAYHDVTDSQTLSLCSELVVSLRLRDYFDWT